MREDIMNVVLKKTMEETNDIVFFLSESGKILYANNLAIKAYGYSKEELLSMSIFDLRKGKEDYINEQFNMAKNEVTDFQTSHYRKDGTSFPVEVKNITVDTKIGKAIISIISDISYKFKQEEEIILLASIVENSEDAIIGNSLDGFIKSWNKGAESLFGYKKDEVLGKHISLIIPEEKSDFFIKVMNKIKNGITVHNYETLRKNKNGELINVSVSISGIYDLQSNLIGVSTIARNITDIKNLQYDLKNSEEKYRQIYTTMSEGLAIHEIILDEVGKPIDYVFLDVNDSYEKITGLKKNEIIGKTVLQILPQTEEYWIKAFGKVALTGKPKRLENYSKELNKYFEVFVYSPEKLKFICLVTDITDRKINEKQLSEKYEELSLVYEELTETEEELRNNYKELERANSVKEQFLANMSHEIRTPMNGIMGITDLLSYTELNHEQTEYLNMIKDCSKILVNIVDNLLDLSKMESGNFNLNNKKFSFKSNIDRIIKEFSSICSSNYLEFIYYVDPLIPDELIGDELRINQILINIMNNAVKFTKEGRIILKINKVSQKNEKIIIKYTVSDTGIGIKEDFKKHLFSKFNQQEVTYTKKYPGTGLGLAISKELVKQMNGEIWAESQEGIGSTFYFTIELLINSIKNPVELSHKGTH